ncbi:hypothetical protein ACFLS9_03460 [Bacteroidota bacterium]
MKNITDNTILDGLFWCCDLSLDSIITMGVEETTGEKIYCIDHGVCCVWIYSDSDLRYSFSCSTTSEYDTAYSGALHNDFIFILWVL